jgi:hypothetical protein
MKKYAIVFLTLISLNIHAAYSMQQPLQLAEKFIAIFPKAQQPLSSDMQFVMSQIQDKLGLIVPLLQDLDENKLSVRDVPTLCNYLEGLKGSLVYLTDLDNASFEGTCVAMSLFHRIESLTADVQKVLESKKLLATPANGTRKKSVNEKKEIETSKDHFDEV